MNKKLIHKINGGLAIYYGMGFAILALISLIFSVVTIFKSISRGHGFPWMSFVGMGMITLIMGLIAYAILRVGYEEVER